MKRIIFLLLIGVFTFTSCNNPVKKSCWSDSKVRSLVRTHWYEIEEMGNLDLPDFNECNVYTWSTFTTNNDMRCGVYYGKTGFAAHFSVEFDDNCYPTGKLVDVQPHK